MVIFNDNRDPIGNVSKFNRGYDNYHHAPTVFLGTPSTVDFGGYTKDDSNSHFSHRDSVWNSFCGAYILGTRDNLPPDCKKIASFYHTFYVRLDHEVYDYSVKIVAARVDVYRITPALELGKVGNHVIDGGYQPACVYIFQLHGDSPTLTIFHREGDVRDRVSEIHEL